MNPVDAHRDAFVQAFLVRDRRERLRSKPAEFLHALCHRLPDWLDHRTALDLTGVRTPEAATRLLVELTNASEAVYLGPWSDLKPGEYQIKAAIAMAETYGGGAVSITPGQLGYYITEQPNARRFLLTTSHQLRDRAAELLARPTPTPPR
ncbi:MAG: hypothetical protein R3B68_07900 [Phycisphaerales bacterium]